MRTKNKNSRFENKNSRSDAGVVIKTVPALAGLIYAAAASVQFLDAEIYLGVADWTFSPHAALIVSLAAFVVVFASSRTRNWEYYNSGEQAIVLVAILIMLSHQYTTTVETLVTNNQPLAGGLAFATGMVAWGVLAR